MKKINMRKYYPSIYNSDMLIEVPDTILQTLEEIYHAEMAFDARVRYYKAYYSMDRDDGIENASVFLCPSPEEIVIRRLDNELLYAAIMQLPTKQAHRLYAHFFLGLSINKIARQEGVKHSAISRSLKRAKKNLKSILLKGVTF